MKYFREGFSAIAIFGLIVYFYHNDLHQYVASIPLGMWLGSVILAWIIMIISGWIIFIGRVGSKPDYKTLMFFPICQSIAGFIFPLQGSLAFSSLYFKYAYKQKLSRIVSLNLALALVSVGLLGLNGFVLAQTSAKSGSSWFFLSCMAVSLFFFTAAFRIKTDRLHNLLLSSENCLYRGVGEFISGFREQLKFLVSQPRLALLYILKIALYWFWFIALNATLNADYEVTELLYLVFAVEASLIFKVTPGNWGVSQATGGIAAALVGAPVEQGVTIITTAMLSVLALNLSVGYFAARFFIGRFEFDSFKNLFSQVLERKKRL